MTVTHKRNDDSIPESQFTPHQDAVIAVEADQTGCE